MKPYTVGDYISPMVLERVCATSGLSQKRVAEILEVAPATLRNVTRGRSVPSLRLLKRVVAVFGGELTDYLSLPAQSRWNLQHLRIAHGYTQREVAEAVGASQPTVCHWENGAYPPSPDAIAKLAEIYRISEERVREIVAATAAHAREDREKVVESAAALDLAEEVLAFAEEATELARSENLTLKQRKAAYAQVRSRTEQALLLVGRVIPQLPPMRRIGAYRLFTGLAAVLNEVTGAVKRSRLN